MSLRKTHILIPFLLALLWPGSAQAVDRSFGPANGDWNDGANWTGGVVPGPGDKAIVSAGKTASIAANPPVPDAVELSGVISVGSGVTLNVASSFSIAAGRLTGAGAVTMAPGSTVTIATLTLDGGVDFTVGTTTNWGGHIGFAGHATVTSLVVPTGATMNHVASATLQSGTTEDSARFVNNGTLVKATSGDTNLNVRFVSTGAVNVNAGFLRMGSPPPAGQRHTGDFAAGAGASMALHGELGSGASFAGAGEITYTGSDGNGVDTIAAGAAVPVDVASLRFGGAITFGSGSSFAVSTTFKLVGGAVLQGPGAIDFAPGSTLSLEMGQLNMPGGFVLTLPPGNGTSWTSGSIVSSTGGPAIVVPAGATFPLLDNGFIAASTSSERLVNNGTVLKTGPGKTTVNSILDNNGTIDVQAGRLGGSTVPTVTQSASGQIRIAAGAALESHVNPLGGGGLAGHGEVWYVTNSGGTIAPGAAAERGVLSGRGLTQTSGGTLAVEIAGTAPGTEFDQYLLTERADLGGTLAIQTQTGFNPSPGQSFRIMTFASRTGTFANVTGADLGGGLFYDVRYNPNDVTLVVAGGPDPDLSIGDVSVTEGNAGTVDAVFPVTLSAASPDPITVDFATADGSAAAPGDYAAGSGTLTFAPGETSKTVTVPIQGDTADEPNESFVVNLSNATNAVIADAQGSGTIVDDDGAPSLSIDDVSVSEGNAGSVSALFTVSLSAASGQPVSVNLATANGSAVAPDDYAAASASLEFAPGETSKTFSVAVQGDTLDEPDESFAVNLSAAVNAGISDGQGVGTIVDDDGAPSLSIADVSMNEGNAGGVNAVFTVTLSPASGQSVSVDFATADGSAIAPGDYGAASGSVSFAPGETSKTFAVSVQGDTADEPDESFLVNLSNAVNAAIADGQATGTIRDDDQPANGAPNAVDDSASVPQDAGPTAVAVLANDSDPDGDPLRISAVTQGAHGAVAITGGGSGVTYDPAQGYVGPDSFTYTVSDGRGGSDTASVTVSVAASLKEIIFTRVDSGGVRIVGMRADGTGQSELATPLGAAEAAWSPDRTRLVYVDLVTGRQGIYTINLDGTDKRRLTNTTSTEMHPAWSPDGTKIAFTRSGRLWVMNADGSDQRRLTRDNATEMRPAWSPDSTKIAFRRGSYLDGNNPEIYVMNADGSGRRRLTTHWSLDDMPDWSPDGRKIVFVRGTAIHVMNADGSGERLLMSGGIANVMPNWSPDGSKIVFASARSGNGDIYVMNADGSGLTRLSTHLGWELEPDW